MAVPTLMGWQEKILTGLPGVRVTPENVRFLDAWARAEGGSYANNPFNTTLQTGAQIGAPNSAGVRGYASPQAGIRATIDTLLNGRYSNILDALRQGSSAAQAASALASSPWGTGSLVQKILGSSDTSTTTPSTPSTPTALPSGGLPEALPGRVLGLNQPGYSTPSLDVLGKSGSALTNALVGASMRSSDLALSRIPNLGMPTSPKATTSVMPASDGGIAPADGFKPGDPLLASQQTSIGGEHDTAGLPGFPAYDYFAKAGSAAVAPASGKIVKLSGHDPSGGPTSGVHGPFGWSVYVQGEDGRIYYMTHMGSRTVKEGDRVRAGQQIGTVGDYAHWGGADHIHMGVSAPGATL